MMRQTWVTIAALLITAPTFAQQTRVPEYARAQAPGVNPQANAAEARAAQQNQARAAQQNQARAGQTQVRPTAQRPAGQPGAANTPQARVADNRVQRPAAQNAPFPPLAPQAQAQLNELLKNWEAQSQGTKTLECRFKRWHYDLFAAPKGVHATYADGVIKYGAPDKGLFQVDTLLFYNGHKENTPQYKAQPGKYGEHWVCNGSQLFEFDRTKKECKIQDLPKNLQGKEIFNSPLPFVFNLDAEKIQRRYWVRQVQSPKPGIVLVEAWPKLQEDRAQYKLVQIALNAKTYLPEALIMFAPNFDEKLAPRWDHYEFIDVKRNSLGQGITQWFGNFIPNKPPANWKILRERFTAPADDPPVQQAQGTRARIQG